MTNTRSAALESRRTASDRPETLVDLLRARALSDPDGVVYELLADGEDGIRTLTAGALDRQARNLGARLQESGAQGSRVVLLLPPGLEFAAAYFGCLYAGAVAVPVLLPRTDSPPDVTRFLEIVADSGARFVLVTPQQRHALPDGLDLRAVTVLTPFNWLEDLSDDWCEPVLEGASLAHLQYTSDGAGSPRGVMLSHLNLLHNAEVVRRAVGVTAEDRLLSWVAPHHELGLMMGLLLPVHAGCAGLLMDPSHFLEAPIGWLQAISRFEVTITAAPNFAYDLCVRHTTRAQRTQLDLSSWRVAMNGSEPVQPRTLEEFSDAFGPSGFDAVGFYPFYSAAEATLLVAGGGRPTAPTIAAFDHEELDAGRARLVTSRTGRLLTSCGQPRPGQLVRVVDPETLNARAPGEVGEIWVGGPGVSAGYWRRRAESMEAFGVFVRDTGEGPFVRTGDLGFLLGGELFITGRLHARLTLGGRSHLPADIEEMAAASHEALVPGGGAAFTVPTQDEGILVVVHELRPRFSRDVPNAEVAQVVRTALARRLGADALDVVLVAPGALPRSPIGKVRRSACRQAYLSGTLAALG